MARTPFLPANTRWQRALFLPLTILAWLAVGIIALWLLGHITHALVMITLAGLLAFALSPLVRMLERWIKRPYAVAFAYLIGIAVIVGLGTVIVVNTVQQVGTFVTNFPSIAQRARELGPRVVAILGPLGVPGLNLQSINDQILGQVQAASTTVATGSLGLLRSAAERVVDAVLVLILSVYFTVSGPKAVSWLRQETPHSVRRWVLYALDVVEHVVGGYVRGTLTMALLIGVLVGVGLAVLRVPYALVLGILAFFMEFIPVVGVLISGVISLLVALPRGLGTTIAVLVYFIIVHIIEGDVLGPRIMGKSVGIHPATGIIALLVGSEVFGIWGTLFAAPIAGLIQAVVVGIWRERGRSTAEVAASVTGEEEHELAQATGR